ncbi:MAG: M20/M25/M40 family metallo-hydrolase [Chloroflexota bacterium]|nr:M20/M25/M40 family metallo-hydrolase [Chloroflexota bacterium]
MLNPIFKERIVDILGDLVRIDTSNPPGNETAAARFLADLLTPAGIQTEVVESAPGRGNLIARLPGSGDGKPLMLIGHLDVVPADASEWRYPPFAAEVHEGMMWGRGTTDMKNMIAAEAVTMLALANLEHPLKRDVLFVATADEERGGHMGMGWLANKRPALFDVACAINEGGGRSIEAAGRVFYTCQSAEKGVCRTVWSAEGESGHGSRPQRDIATLKLSRALPRLDDGYVRGHVTDTMRRALHVIASSQSKRTVSRVETLLDQGRVEDALETAGFDQDTIEACRPLFYDTASVTGLRAGDPESINVIPANARAYVDGRILPGQTREGFLELLRHCAGDEIKIEVFEEQFAPGLESSIDSALVRTISDVIAERCDGAQVVPWQCAGSTDAKHLIDLGIPVYGFVPSKPLPKDVETAGAHAIDERIWLEGLPFTLEILYEVVHRFCNQA